MTGHKGQIYALAFSVEGRFLASAGSDYKIMLWDLAHGHLLAELSGHTGTIHTLSFSRDGNLLTSGIFGVPYADLCFQFSCVVKNSNYINLFSGSLDCTIKIWDFTKLAEEMSLEDVNVSHNPDIKNNSDNYLLRSYATKSSPILSLHFTRRNLMLAVGMYDS